MRTDPLLQFVLLGAVIFGLQAWLQPAEPEPIWVPAGLDAQQRAHFENTQLALREARRLGLDQGDSIIERQLQQKLRLLIESRAVVAAPDEVSLRAYLDERQEHYRQSPQMDLRLSISSRSQHGEQARAVAEKALEQLRAQAETVDEAGAGDVELISLNGVRHSDLRRRYGRTLADQLAAQPVGDWHGPFAFGLGWYGAQVLRREAAPAPDFAAVRRQLEIDWMEEQREAAWQAELQRLRAAARFVEEPE